MKAPTAEETLSAAYKEAGWMYQLSVASGSCDHVSIALAAIESHTQAHTEGLRERVKELEAELNDVKFRFKTAIQGLRSANEIIKKLNNEA